MSGKVITREQAVNGKDYRSGQGVITREEAISNSKKSSQKSSAYINSFVNDVNKFSRSVESDISGKNLFNAADYFKERKRQADELKKRAATVASNLEANADSYTPEYYDSMVEYLSNFDTMVDDVLSNYKPSLDSREGMRAYEDEMLAAIERNSRYVDERKPHYGTLFSYNEEAEEDFIPDYSYRSVNGNWTPEQRYTLGQLQLQNPEEAQKYATEVNRYFSNMDQYAEQERRRHEMAALDLDAAKREIDQLQAELDSFYATHDYTGDAEYRQKQKELTQKETLYNQAVRNREAEAFKSVKNNADFAEKSNYVSTEAQNFRDRMFSEYGMGYNDLTYEYINDPERVQGYNDEFTRRMLESNYELMQNDEIWIYNYLHATEGKDKAQEYLDSIQDELGRRRAEQIYSNLEGKTAKEIAFGVNAGLNQFMTSTKNLMSNADYLPVSATQQASQMVRQDLQDRAAIKKAETGVGSVAPLLYDVTTTTANMLPSMAAGALANVVLPGSGGYVGSALMGMSASGGAYQEALNSGYSKEQARTYSTMVGIAETGMESLLGIVGGGMPDAIKMKAIDAVDGALAKFAVEQGFDMLSEGTEEALQEVISPWLEEVFLNAEKRDVDLKEVAYSGLLGALSTLPFAVPKGVRTALTRSSLRNTPATAAAPAVEAKTFQTTVETPKVSTEGKAMQISSQKALDVKDFASMGDKGATLMTNDGEVVNYDDVSWADQQQANQFYAVRSLPGLDTEAANDLLTVIQNADAGQDTDSVVGIRDAYRIGYFNQDVKGLKTGDASVLSPELRQAVYDIGVRQNQAEAAVKASATAVTTKPSEGYKKVTLEGNIKLDTNQKAQVDFIDKFSDKVSKTSVHVFESYVKNGKRYYKDSNGKEVLAPNGKYVNGEIWVDLKAGDKGEGMVLNTFAHELYHHIESQNKAGANKLASWVSKNMGIKNVDAAVEAQIRKARAAGFGEKYFRDKGMSPEQARNEVYARAMSDFVADSLETMFTRGDPAEAIAQLYKEDRTLFDQIKEFIDKFISQVKQFYSDKTISAEGAAVAQLDNFLELQRMFMEAAKVAGENYQAAEVTESTNAKFQARSSFKNGIYTNIDTRRYWYPNMTKSEIADVKSLADHEANTTDNYLGIDSKWLYNNQKGHKYFALYSTADAQGTTLLYACKGKNAEYEYNILKGVLEMEDGLYGSTDSGSETISQILDRTERTTNRQSSDSGRVRRTGSNNGNASVHSKNTRTRSSAAFRNCLENISKVQSRYGVDDHYLFAVEIGDFKTAQRMVDEAAAKAFKNSYLKDKNGNLIKLYHGSSEKFNVFRGKEISGLGNYFSPWKSVAEGYGDTRPFYVNLTNPTLYDYDWNQINDISEENADGIVYVPEDIKNDIKQNRVGETEVIVFDSKQIKSAEPVTYDDNGNIIPISQRFDPDNEDVLYSLRGNNKDSSGNELSEAQKEFFKDSIVRDKKGRLLIVYHGTTANFNIFKKGDVGYHFGTNGAARGRVGYGKNVTIKSVYLNITNPIEFDEDLGSWDADYRLTKELYNRQILSYDEAMSVLRTDDGRFKRTTGRANEKLVEILKSKGYDGIVYQNSFETKKETTSYIVFSSNQAKEITNTNPTADLDIRHSLRNEKPLTNRQILEQLDIEKRRPQEKGHLNTYRERLAELREKKPKLAEVKSRIQELSADSVKNKAEISKLKAESRSLKRDVDSLNRKIREQEQGSMFVKIVGEERLKAQKQQARDSLKSYKDEQRELVKEMQLEQRVIREELTGKKSDITIMEREFVRIAKQYEKLDERTGKKSAKDAKVIAELKAALKEEAKSHSEDSKIWEREFNRLLKDYETSGRQIERLEATILRQRATAKARVESRRNTEMRHKIQKKVNELDQLLRHGSKHRNVPEFLQDSVAAVLQAINMEVRDGDQRRKSFETTLARYDRQIAMTSDTAKVADLIEKRNAYEAKGDQFANRMEKLQAAYKQIREENTGIELDEGIAGHLDSLFETVGNTPLGQMNAAQLDAVNDILNVTMATVRNANKLLAEERSAGVLENSKDAVREIKSAGETKKTKTRLRKNLEQFGWNNLKPSYVFDVIGSKTLTKLYESLRSGEDTLAVDLDQAKKFFQEQWKKNGGKEWDMEKKWKFESTSGKSFELDLNQIMSLYAMSKDKDARSHLRVGGFAFDSDYQTKEDINIGPVKIPVKVESSDASAYNLSDEILGEIISTLTPQQRAFADAMQAYLSDTMAAKGNEVSLKKYGIRLFKKKDYFPIRVADQFMAKAREQQAGDRKLKDSGFTKERKPEAKNPVVLSAFTEIWAEHVDEMSLYHSFVLPLDDFNRVLNYHDAFVEGQEAVSVVEAITNAFGKGATNYIDQLIKDVNGGIKGGSTVSFANSLVSKAKKAQTMASLSVAIQQPSSIIRAMSVVDSKYFFGPKVTEKTTERTWEEIKQHAPIAIIKEMGGYDTNVGKSTVDYLTDTADYETFGEKFKALFTDSNYRDEQLGRLPAWMDETSWGVIWNAVKREQKDIHPNMDVNSRAFMKSVADRFTEVITRTQVYDSVFSRSGLMRDKNDLAKVITSFMAEPTTTANMLAVSILQAKRGDISKAQRNKTTAAIVASLALNAALVSIVYAMRDDDEDKRYDEKWMENFRNNFFESLNPVGYIPYVRDIYNVFVKGYDVERADMELFGDLQNALDGLDNDDISAWDKTEAVIGSIGNLLGVPVKNILRDVKGIVQTFGFAFDDRKNPKTKTGTYMAIRGKDLNDKEQMILAVRKGDEEHLQRVFGRYETQEDAESALQQAIREKYVAGEMDAEEAQDLLDTYFDREDEYEVYWLLDKWDYAKEHGNTDSYTKMGKLLDTIENGGDYVTEWQRYLDHGSEMSDIRSAISGKYKKMYMAADKADREDLQDKLLQVYMDTGMYESDVLKKFSEWDFEAEYGMSYSDLKAEYREGNITESDLREAMKFNGLMTFEMDREVRELNEDIAFRKKFDMSLSEMKDAFDAGDVSRNVLIKAMEYTGKTKAEAQQEVKKREIRNRLGIDYMELDDAYKAGDISRQTLYNAMIEAGSTKQEADDAILGYDWLKKNYKKYPDLTISDAKKFAVRLSSDQPDYTLTDFGVKIDDYIEYSKLRPDCKGVDNNGDGKADDGTKRDAIFRMIDSLPISSEAKDGLALLDYGFKSIRKNAPWH